MKSVTPERARRSCLVGCHGPARAAVGLVLGACGLMLSACGSDGSSSEAPSDAGGNDVEMDGGNEEPGGGEDSGSRGPDGTGGDDGMAGSGGQGGEASGGEAAGGDGGEEPGDGGEAGAGMAGEGGTGGDMGAGGAGMAGDGQGGSAGGGMAGGGGAGGMGPDEPPAAEHALVGEIVSELALGQAAEPWVANMTRTPLDASRGITPVRGSSDFSPTDEYYFAYVDRLPSARFEHPTQFVFAEADQDLVVEEHGWWPDLDGVGFVLADVELVKLFSPIFDGAPAEVPYPGENGVDRRGASPEAPIFAFYPDYQADTGEARVFFYADANVASATPAYVNVLADLDGDGVWDPAQGERLVTNFALPSASAGWAVTDAFEMPVDAANRFVSSAWVRVAVTRDPVPEAETEAEEYCTIDVSLYCTDSYYDYSTWSGPDCTSEDENSGCSGPTITWGPTLPNPPVPEIEGAASSFTCQPDGIVIPTVTKALVINTGDTSGRTDSEYEMNKVAALFSLRYGDDGVAKLNNPTAERALEAIRALVSELQCLDEANLYITGHGAENTGELWVRNGYGGITPAQLHDAITMSAEHCPAPMDYATTDGCRINGYCDLSVYLTSCYSGLFLDGDKSLMLPGLNVLTAASATSPAYAEIDGFKTGEQVGHAFVQGFVDNKADAAPYGNGDGVTDPAEAQRYAQAEYEKAPASNPQLWQGADCACNCEAEPCGNGVLDSGEECDPMEATSSCSVDFTCSQECTCECSLTQEDCGTEMLDVELCQCVPYCGNGLVDNGEACDPSAAVTGCDGNFECSEACECECTLVPTDCSPGQQLDAETCECVDINHCPPVGGFTLTGFFSVFSDPFGHSCCHNVPVGPEVVIPFERLNGTFSSPGLPGQDIPPMTGTIVNDPLLGCLIEGGGTGVFADFSNSQCLLQNGVILNGMFTGQVQCTPSGFPAQPITFDLDAFATVP